MWKNHTAYTHSNKSLIERIIRIRNIIRKCDMSASKVMVIPGVPTSTSLGTLWSSLVHVALVTSQRAYFLQCVFEH